MKSKISRKNCDYENIELYKIFQQGNDFNLLKLFLDTHGGINAIDEYGRTALVNCIIDYNNPIKKIVFANEYAKKLVDLGIDVNKKDFNGRVALQSCISAKNYEMLDFLLEVPHIDIHTQPNLLECADITNSLLIIKLIKSGLNPFEKDDSGYSFYDVLKEFDDGIVTIGAGKVNVKPIMDFINSASADLQKNSNFKQKYQTS
jgi:ankyrin repeat protein